MWQEQLPTTSCLTIFLCPAPATMVAPLQGLTHACLWAFALPPLIDSCRICLFQLIQVLGQMSPPLRSPPCTLPSYNHSHPCHSHGTDMTLSTYYALSAASSRTVGTPLVPCTDTPWHPWPHLASRGWGRRMVASFSDAHPH